MSRMCGVGLAVVLAMVTSAGAAEAQLPAAGEVPGYLQDISVTIKADSSEGSGVVRCRRATNWTRS